VYLKNLISYRYGQQVSEVSEKSSNYRELKNLVNTMKKLYQEGCLKDCELFLFTDKIVSDYAYYKLFSFSKLFIISC